MVIKSIKIKQIKQKTITLQKKLNKFNYNNDQKRSRVEEGCPIYFCVFKKKISNLTNTHLS